MANNRFEFARTARPTRKGDAPLLAAQAERLAALPKEDFMKPCLNVLTLAVTDLEKSLAFYRDGLGWPTEGIVGEEFKGDATNPSGRVAFFNLEGGLIFALYPDLSKDAKRPAGNGIEFSMGYFVNSNEEVDALLERAQKAGATVTDGGPHERPWGIYSGYFQDLDGHSWEIIFKSSVEASN